jgi:hypothetical protein
MFGMLDYRAHKLWILLFGIPRFVMWILAVFGLSILAYGIGLKYGSNHFWMAVIAIVLTLPIELVWALFATLIERFFKFLFGLFIDVIPHDGRTKEEADLVLWGGETAITVLNVNKPASEWADADMHKFARGEWWIGWLFYGNVMERMEYLKNYYLSNPEIDPAYADVDSILAIEGIGAGKVELAITNPYFRSLVIRYGFLLYLIVFNPAA